MVDETSQMFSGKSKMKYLNMKGCFFAVHSLSLYVKLIIEAATLSPKASAETNTTL